MIRKTKSHPWPEEKRKNVDVKKGHVSGLIAGLTTLLLTKVKHMDSLFICK